VNISRRHEHVGQRSARYNLGTARYTELRRGLAVGAERDRVSGFGQLQGLPQAREWYRWGPYVREGPWGTVGEYSADGEEPDYPLHDHACDSHPVSAARFHRGDVISARLAAPATTRIGTGSRTEPVSSMATALAAARAARDAR
jgi:hypothetical protein